MKKNIKRYLSYVLGVILAMGLGLSYAYAVGANDSNAFVTTTEWETKVAQIEASLDNVTKTINDTNMDFVLSGPRLQMSMVDGYENQTVRMNLSYSGYQAAVITNLTNAYPRYSNCCLADTWNGFQKTYQMNPGNSNLSYPAYMQTCKFALKTTTPNVYMVIGWYSMASIIINYVYVGSGAQDVSAKTLTVEIPLDEWGLYNGANTTPGNIARTNSNLYISHGTASPNNQFSYENLTAENANTGSAWFTRTVDSANNKVTYIFEYPANQYSMKIYGVSNWILLKRNMTGKKYANMADLYYPTLTNTNFYVAKVYSPVKGCLCLKSYLNGEIPILNE